MIKNVVFDFGNVIYKYFPEVMTAKHIENKEDIKLVSSVIFDRLYWSKLDEGKMTAEECKRLAKERLPERLHEITEEVYNSWVDDLEANTTILDLIKYLKENRKVSLYLLSNMSYYFVERKEKFDIFNYFDGLVFSCEIKTVKPDRKIYDYLLTRYNLNPKETYFIDDNKDNIKAAKDLGIDGYNYNFDTESLKADLLPKLEK